MEDGQDRAVGRRVQELVRMPARGERTGFGLAVADDAGADQVGVVECGSVRVRDSVPELSALVDRAWRLRSHVAWNTARKRKLREKSLHAFVVRGDVRVDLAVGTLEVRVCNQARAAMSGACDIDHVKVVLLDYPVQV